MPPEILLLSEFTAQAAPFAYIANYNTSSYSSDDGVSVVDLATNKAVSSIPTQGNPWGVAIKPDGSRVYVTNEYSDSVTAIDTSGNGVVAHIPVGNNPMGIAVKPDGTRVYVANWYSYSISVIDTATNIVIATVGTGTAYPQGIAVNPAGTRLFVTLPNSDQVAVIDTADNAVKGYIVVGDNPQHIAFKPDGTRAYVSNFYSDTVTVINTADNSIVTSVAVGDGPTGIVANPAGTRVYVANQYGDKVSVIDTTTNMLIGSIPAGDQPNGIDTNAAGTRIYVANYGLSTVSVINTGNNTLIANIPVGLNPMSLGRFVGPQPINESTQRLSLSSGRLQGRGESVQAAVSANGRYVAFASDAPNLIGGDTNGSSDIFVRDRVSGTLIRISVATGGVQSNGSSFDPVISDDGRYIAFESDATNLVSADTNETNDIFVHDRTTRQTTRVSIATGAAGAQGNEASTEPSISQDGRYVVFASLASNLVAGDTNGLFDVFLRDRTANTTARVSVGAAAAQAVGGDSFEPFISDDGKFVAFTSAATNLVAGDTNGKFDIFVRNLTAGTTARSSVSSAAAQANGDSWQPALNNTGSFVVFASDAANLVANDTNGVTDIFTRNGTATARHSLDVSGNQSDEASYNPVISNDGRYIAFTSYSALDALDYNGYADVYVRDRTGLKTRRASVSTGGAEGNSESLRPAMSGDGRYILFESWATNLVAGDSNQVADIFARDRGVGSAPTYPRTAQSPTLTEPERR